MYHVSCVRRCVSDDSPLAEIKIQYGSFAWDEDLRALKRIDFTSCEGSSAGDVDDKYYSKVFIYYLFQ